MSEEFVSTVDAWFGAEENKIEYMAYLGKLSLPPVSPPYPPLTPPLYAICRQLHGP